MKHVAALIFILSSLGILQAQSGLSGFDIAQTPAKSWQLRSTERSGIVLQGPHINFTGNRICTFSRTLRNTADSSVSFHFAHLPQVDSEVINFLFSRVTATDTETIRYQLVVAVAEIIKSPYFVNQTLFYNGTYNDSALFAKEESPIGFLHGVPETQCGNYARFARALLISTGYFSVDDFEVISNPGHTICHIRLWGKYTMVDFDPGEPGFMQPNPNSPNGFADIYELRADTNLINVLYTYHGERLSYLSLSDYRLLLSLSPLSVTPAFIWPVAQLNGTFTLPAYAEVEIPVPLNFLFFDTAQLSGKESYLRFNEFINQYAQDFEQQYADSLLALVTSVFGISQTQATQMLDGTTPATLVAYNSVTQYGMAFGDVFRYRYPRGDISKWIINFNAPANGLIIGSDVKIPGYVLAVENQNNSYCQLQDTAFTGNTSFNLWDSNSAPWATHQTANYLEANGLLNQDNYSISVSINGNTRMICAADDWVIEGQNAEAIVNSTQITTTSSGPLSVASQLAEKPSVVYPNPVAKGSAITFTCRADLYNSLGQLLTSFTPGKHTINFSPGIYYLKTVQKTSTLIIK